MQKEVIHNILLIYRWSISLSSHSKITTMYDISKMKKGSKNKTKVGFYKKQYFP